MQGFCVKLSTVKLVEILKYLCNTMYLCNAKNEITVLNNMYNAFALFTGLRKGQNCLLIPDKTQCLQASVATYLAFPAITNK